MKITTVGLDLAKEVFHVVCCNQAGKLVKKKKLKRAQLLAYFAQLPPCLVGMEACASAHYWARSLRALGHQVKLLPPQHVKPYIRGQKNDYNDAAGIAEAVTRPGMLAVEIKTIEQQDIQALHRLRNGRVKERTALCNQLRGLLGEYGIIIPRGVGSLRKQLPDILACADNGLSDLFRPLLAEAYQQLDELDTRIDYYTKAIERESKQDDRCQRLQTLPGFGPIISSVFASHVGNGRAYHRGRDVSASIGLVPRQHSSGDKQVLLGITKRGDKYLRSLLIHGARTVVMHAEKKDDHLSRWINRIREKRGYNKATVALANKLARMGWAVLRNNTVYQPAEARLSN